MQDQFEDNKIFSGINDSFEHSSNNNLNSLLGYSDNGSNPIPKKSQYNKQNLKDRYVYIEEEENEKKETFDQLRLPMMDSAPGTSRLANQSVSSFN